MSWKKRFVIFTGVLAGLLCLLGAWYFGHYTKTPDYALQQIDQALEKKDVARFAEYVDVDGVLDSSYDDFMNGILDTEQPLDEEARAAVGSFAQMVRAPLLASFRQAIMTHVETGNWPAEEEGRDVSGLLGGSDVLERAGLKGTTIQGIDRVEKESQSEAAVAFVRVYSEEADDTFVLRVCLRPGENGRYRVVSVDNFRDFLVMIGRVRRAQLAEYLDRTSEIIAAHEAAMREAEGKRADILAAGALGSAETRTKLKQLMEETVIPDWQARAEELRAVDVAPAAETLQKVRLRICDCYIAYAEGYAQWMDDKQAATIRDAENQMRQAKALEQEERFLARRVRQSGGKEVP